MFIKSIIGTFSKHIQIIPKNWYKNHHTLIATPGFFHLYKHSLSNSLLYPRLFVKEISLSGRCKFSKFIFGHQPIDEYCRYRSGLCEVPKPIPFFENNDVLSKDATLTTNGWESFISECKEKKIKYSGPSLDTQILRYCLLTRNKALASSFIEYSSKTRNEKLNFVAMSLYFLIIADNFSDSDEDLFRKLHEQLLREPCIPNNIILVIIHALCLTKFWKEVFHSKIISRMHSDRNMAHNFVIMALLREEGILSASKYLKSLQEVHINEVEIEESFTSIELLPETINSCLKSLYKSSTAELKDEHFSYFFEMLQITKGSIPEKHIKTLFDCLPSHWDYDYVKIGNRRNCSCGLKLLPVPLDRKIFSKLREEYLAKAVRGRDIYQKTTPEEWDNFIEFLNKTGSYDIIIDGLNIFYMYSNKTQMKRRGCHKIEPDFVFLDLQKKFQGQRSLVITRNHMKKSIIRHKSKFTSMDFYFVNDISDDDIFTLYAALWSGIDCKIVTRDYLRNYQFALEDPILKQQFYYWQSLNQIILKMKRGEPGIIIKQPYQYHRIAQWNKYQQTWHIPVKTDEDKDYMDGAHDWLCLKKRTTTVSSVT